jgi:hypothetical protein
MSIPSISDISGQLSMASGILCVVTAGILKMSGRKPHEQKQVIDAYSEKNKIETYP